MTDPDQVLAVAAQCAPRPVAWADLLHHDAPGTRDRRSAAAVLIALGLHPIALHGIAAEGGCTCNKGKSCGAAGKHPVLSAWQKLSLDPPELDAMLATNWRLNLGLRMGPQPSGAFLVAIDVDGPPSLLEPLEKKHGPLPPTLTARTGSGGLHFVFRVRPGVELANRAGIEPHVDIRGAGGQIVVSPSRHRTGSFYSWLDVREPAELP